MMYLIGGIHMTWLHILQREDDLQNHYDYYRKRYITSKKSEKHFLQLQARYHQLLHELVPTSRFSFQYIKRLFRNEQQLQDRIQYIKKRMHSLTPYMLNEVEKQEAKQQMTILQHQLQAVDQLKQRHLEVYYPVLAQQVLTIRKTMLQLQQQNHTLQHLQMLASALPQALHKVNRKLQLARVHSKSKPNHCGMLTASIAYETNKETAQVCEQTRQLLQHYEYQLQGIFPSTLVQQYDDIRYTGFIAQQESKAIQQLTYVKYQINEQQHSLYQLEQTNTQQLLTLQTQQRQIWESVQ